MKKPQEGKHWYSGECGPGSDYPIGETFSVGIFKWVKKKSGMGLKKSAVIYRIKGSPSKPDRVYNRAQEVCMYMDIGVWIGPGKSETVR